MKDKEMIEEMARKVCQHPRLKDFYKTCKECNDGGDCYIYNLCKKLSEHYQPKLLENSVVLSKEKYELLVECSSYEGVMKALKNEYTKGSKETVEKYKGFIRELLTNGDDSITTYYGGVKYRLIREDDLQELAKQLGIEIGQDNVKCKYFREVDYGYRKSKQCYAQKSAPEVYCNGCISDCEISKTKE